MHLDDFTAMFEHTARVTRHEYTSDDLDSYWIELNHLSAQELGAALARCTKELERFPTVGQIRKRLPAVETVPGWQQRVRRNCELKRLVDQAREGGASTGEVDALIEKFDKQMA